MAANTLESAARKWYSGSVIGPTVSIPVTHQFAIDTEKYSNQVKLDPMPNGGFDIEGYVAGLPFPTSRWT